MEFLFNAHSIKVQLANVLLGIVQDVVVVVYEEWLEAEIIVLRELFHLRFSWVLVLSYDGYYFI